MIVAWFVAVYRPSTTYATSSLEQYPCRHAVNRRAALDRQRELAARVRCVGYAARDCARLRAMGRLAHTWHFIADLPLTAGRRLGTTRARSPRRSALAIHYSLLPHTHRPTRCSARTRARAQTAAAAITTATMRARTRVLVLVRATRRALTRRRAPHCVRRAARAAPAASRPAAASHPAAAPPPPGSAPIRTAERAASPPPSRGCPTGSLPRSVCTCRCAAPTRVVVVHSEAHAARPRIHIAQRGHDMVPLAHSKPHRRQPHVLQQRACAVPSEETTVRRAGRARAGRRPAGRAGGARGRLPSSSRCVQRRRLPHALIRGQ